MSSSPEEFARKSRVKAGKVPARHDRRETTSPSPAPAPSARAGAAPTTATTKLPPTSLLHPSSTTKSAFMPYRPPPTVLTNLQRGNTEATFCPVEVMLSFHERSGQGEITAEQVRHELEQQPKAEHGEPRAGIDFRDSYDFTPLHWASFYGQLATVQLLLDAGADVNAQAPEMVTPLVLAACGGHHEVVRLLLDRGAHSGHMDIMGNTALMYAAAGNHPHSCNEILSRDPDMMATNENGESAYALAVENGAALAQAVIEQYLSALISL